MNTMAHILSWHRCSSSCESRSDSLSELVLAGALARTGMGSASAHGQPQTARRAQLQRQSAQHRASTPDHEPRQRQKSGFAWWSKLSRWIAHARLGVVLLAMTWLTGCAVFSRPPAVPVPLVCAPAALQQCAPLQIEVPAVVVADAAGEIAIALKLALDECSARHSALIDCVKNHGKKGK